MFSKKLAIIEPSWVRRIMILFFGFGLYLPIIIFYQGVISFAKTIEEIVAIFRVWIKECW